MIRAALVGACLIGAAWWAWSRIGFLRLETPLFTDKQRVFGGAEQRYRTTYPALPMKLRLARRATRKVA